MRRNRTYIFLFLLIQLVGYMLMFLLKWRHVAPCTELLHISPWWEFSATGIWALMVALPAFYAYAKHLRGRWLIITIAVLPITIVLLLALAGICLHAFHVYNIKQARKQMFNTPGKIEQVAGVRLPAFHITNYSEQSLHDALLKKHICRVEATFDNIPPADFYQQLDSLCTADSLHWRGHDGTYAYDSIYGRKQISKLVLALVLTKGEKEFEIHYDDCVKFKISNPLKKRK